MHRTFCSNDIVAHFWNSYGNITQAEKFSSFACFVSDIGPLMSYCSTCCVIVSYKNWENTLCKEYVWHGKYSIRRCKIFDLKKKLNRKYDKSSTNLSDMMLNEMKRIICICIFLVPIISVPSSASWKPGLDSLNTSTLYQTNA